ncbi:MAG: VanW family protein [Patescibacteria group bacterium]|nr:VanW family protein [Patescibacteria group bacterium]
MARFRVILTCLYLPVLCLFLPKVVLAAPAGQDAAVFTYQDQVFTADSQTLNSWKGSGSLNPRLLITNPVTSLADQLAEFSGKKIPAAQPVSYQYQPDKIYNFVKGLESQINATVTEPSLTIQDNRAVNFTPPQNGQSLDAYQTALNAAQALSNGQYSVTMEVNQTFPQASLAQTNGLGINSLIAHGESNFKGSPKNRVHNIEVGVEKMKGIIIAPGDTFSFNRYLGPVDGQHGFLPELVIKSNGTVPEFGGGLCQVSSTTFRAAMDGGLPIVERRNHAYAVSYYSPQGTDATIYPGVVDLKFTNDTPGSILIWPYFKDKNTLVFDFYGTKDSRQVTLEKPVQWDRKANGAMKASWTRITTKDGETSTSTFTSTYLPPALFHKEETSTPSQPPPSGMRVGDPSAPPNN